MDNGFPILDAFSDDQAFERHFGSLLDDATNQLPDLDSGVLGTNDPVTGDDGLDDALGQEFFSTGLVQHGVAGFSSLPSPGGPMLGGAHQTVGKNNYGGQGGGSAQPPASPLSHQFTSPSPAPPQSPAVQMKSPVSLPPPSPMAPPKSPMAPPQSPMAPPQSPMAPPKSPANILYTKSPAPHLPPPSPQTPLLSPQPQILQQPQVSSGSILLPVSAVSAGANTFVPGAAVLTQPIQLSAAGQTQAIQLSACQHTAAGMIQLQLQPNVSVQNSTKIPSLASLPITPGKGKQPQLLPKPSSSQSNNVSSSQPQKIVASSSQLMTVAAPAAGHTWVTAPAQPGQQLVMAGQVVGQQAPVFIQQQPTQPGNMIMIRAPQPTMLPVNGQIILQQPAQAGQPATIMQAAPAGQPAALMPNVKLITPQTRMQKIQTTAGAQLIAVPMGQTIIQGANGQLLTQPNIVAAAPNIALSQPAAAAIQLSGPAPVSHLVTSTAPLNINTQSVIQPTLASTGAGVLVSTGVSGVNPVTGSPVLSPTKKKKPKKKRRDDEISAENKALGAVDLGALMKDVGLDLDFSDDLGFGLESSSHNDGHNSTLNSSLNSSSSSDIDADPAPVSAPAQLRLPVSNTPQLSQQPAVNPQLSTQTVSTAAPHQSLQLVQGPDGNFILQTSSTPAAPAEPTVFAPAATSSSSASSLSSVTTSTTSHPSLSSHKTSPIRPPPRARNIADVNRTPLFEDETLPVGWKRKVSQRKSGASAGRYEVFIIGPTGKRFRSRNELKSFFEKQGETSLNPDDFDFSTFGRNSPKVPAVNTVSVSSVVTTSSSVKLTSSVTSSVVVTSSMPSIVTSTLQSQPSSSASSSSSSSSSLSETELIKNLENSAMASVAAARALEVTNQGLGMRNTLLQSIQQPLPPAILTSTASAAPVTQTKPVPAPLVIPPPSTGHPVKVFPPTPLSADMEDAESQITQLLESLQSNNQSSSTNTTAVSSDQDFFDSLTTQAPTTSVSSTEPFTKSSRLSSSPSMPVLQPQVSLAETPQETSFQNKYLDSLARSQITEKSKSRHESGGMPMLSPTTGIMHTGHSPRSPASPMVSAAPATVTRSPVIQPVPGIMSSGPPNVTVQTSVTSSNCNMAGPVSQLRALQQLPPNTRLQHGPNGQVMIQKIQTIELSPPMQQQYKQLAHKISLIEQKQIKTPQDEADLAEIQAKQHQILSTGRPLFNQQQQQQHPVPNVVAPPVQLPQQPPLVRAAGPGGAVPPLTDAQKKIVAEFKSKMIRLPPAEQAVYITKNKMNLIKQLNFQPNQLKILQNPVTNISTAPVIRPQPPPNMSLIHHQPSGIIPPRLQQPPALRPPSSVTSVQSSAGVSAIDKSKKVAWFETQLRNDQKEATVPNYKTPFRSREDTVKRLLRYHVYNEQTVEEEDLINSDLEFERRSETLLARYQVNLSKYHLLLLDESTRLSSSSNEVMLGRMWVSEERAALAREKEEYRNSCNKVIELERREKQGEHLSYEEKLDLSRAVRAVDTPALPPLPETWASKYEEIVGLTWDTYKHKTRSQHQTQQDDDTAPALDSPEHRVDDDDDDLEELPPLLQERHYSPQLIRSRNSSVCSVDDVLRRDSIEEEESDPRRDSVEDDEMDSLDARKKFSELTKSFRPSSSLSDKNFVGLKFNRSHSTGRWSTSLKREAEDDLMQFGGKKSKVAGDWGEDSSDDEDFSLADVGGNNAAVQSMLGNDDDDHEDDLDQEDDELRFDNQSRMSSLDIDHHLRFTQSPCIPTTDSNNMNNAINSLLDFDRASVQTPEDLKHLTGLLDSSQ